MLDRGSRVDDLPILSIVHVDELQQLLQAVSDPYPVRRADKKPWKSENIIKINKYKIYTIFTHPAFMFRPARHPVG